jgi:hypothetical protein
MNSSVTLIKLYSKLFKRWFNDNLDKISLFSLILQYLWIKTKFNENIKFNVNFLLNLIICNANCELDIIALNNGTKINLRKRFEASDPTQMSEFIKFESFHFQMKQKSNFFIFLFEWFIPNFKQRHVLYLCCDELSF